MSLHILMLLDIVSSTRIYPNRQETTKRCSPRCDSGYIWKLKQNDSKLISMYRSIPTVWYFPYWVRWKLEWGSFEIQYVSEKPIKSVRKAFGEHNFETLYIHNVKWVGFFFETIVERKNFKHFSPSWIHTQKMEFNQLRNHFFLIVSKSSSVYCMRIKCMELS